MPRRAFLVAVVSKYPELHSGTMKVYRSQRWRSLEELGELVTSRGYQVVGQTVQMRTRPDPGSW